MPQAFVPYSVESLLEVDEVVEQVSLMLKMFFHQDVAVKNLFYCAPACPEPSLFLCKVFCLLLESVQNNFEHDLAGVADEADCSIVLALALIPLLGQRYDE